MNNVITFETRFGILNIETTCQISMDQLNEVQEQLNLCASGNSNICRLNEGIEGSSRYMENSYRGYTMSFESKSRIYPSHWMDNLFKIVHQILVTNN